MVISSETIQRSASPRTKQMILAFGKRVMGDIMGSVADSTNGDCNSPTSPISNVDQGIRIEMDSLSSTDLSLSLDNGSDSEEPELPTVILDEIPDFDEGRVVYPVNGE